MPDVIIPDKAAKNVIRVNGVCYELVGSTTDPTTHTMEDIQGEFDDCSDCFNEESSSESADNSSSQSADNSSSSDSSWESDPCSNPSMFVTVTGPSGTVNWAGKTWVLPGDSGKTKETCPTGYGITTQRPCSTCFGTPTPLYTTEAARSQSWRRGTGASQLWMSMRWGYYAEVRYYFGEMNVNVAGVANSLFQGIYFSTIPFWDQGQGQKLATMTPTNTATPFNNNGLGLGWVTADLPTYNSYMISEEMFGSHTIGAITYTWARGRNW